MGEWGGGRDRERRCAWRKGAIFVGGCHWGEVPPLGALGTMYANEFSIFASFLLCKFSVFRVSICRF